MYMIEYLELKSVLATL